MKTSSPSSQSVPSADDEIRFLAYELWIQAGCPAGKDQHFWLEAERQIDAQPRATEGAQAHVPSVRAGNTRAKPPRATRGIARNGH